jgi:peptidase M23-like protein
MPFVVWLPLVAQLLIPLALLGWLASGHPANRASWVLRAILTLVYLTAITGAGLWLILPWYTPALYAAAFLLVAIVSGRRLGAVPRWPRRASSVAEALATAALAAGCVVLIVQVGAGRRPPPASVDLSFPLRDGTYLVVNGGARALINGHFATLTGERFGRWRGQSFGVDLVKLDGFGRRARGILPRDPAAYAIFGDSVHAPCAGTVIGAVDGAPEMRPPAVDRRNMAGNYVILGCGNVWVLLGHLRRGSVAVRVGDTVHVGQPLGRVGNSGNTNEPHLHIHAQRPGTLDAPFSGDPLPIRFGVTYPARSTRVRCPPRVLLQAFRQSSSVGC